MIPIKYKIEVRGKVQIWTEFHIVNENEIHLKNHRDFAADVALILDRETKVCLESVHCYIEPNQLKFLEVIYDYPRKQFLQGVRNTGRFSPRFFVRRSNTG